MQILIHIPIFNCILSRLIRTRNTSVQMLQMLRKAESNLERIHGAFLGDLAVAPVRNGNTLIFLVYRWRIML